MDVENKSNRFKKRKKWSFVFVSRRETQVDKRTKKNKPLTWWWNEPPHIMTVSKTRMKEFLQIKDEETSCVPSLTFALKPPADSDPASMLCLQRGVFTPSRRECTANTRLRTDSSKTSKQCTAFQTHNGWDHHTGPLEKPAGKSSQGSQGPASVQPGFPQLVLGIEHNERRIDSL